MKRTAAEEAEFLSVPMKRVLYAAMLGGALNPHYATRRVLVRRGLILGVIEGDTNYWHATKFGKEVGEASLGQTNEQRRRAGIATLNLEEAWRLLEMVADQLRGYRG